MRLCEQKWLLRSVLQKDVLSDVRISTNTRRGENSNVISDQMTALYLESPLQRTFS